MESTHNECVFCMGTNDLYQSTVCECTNLFFCKKCIAEYYASNTLNAKKCPQCETPLKLRIDSIRVWWWTTLTSEDFIRAYDDIYNYICTSFMELVNRYMIYCAFEPYYHQQIALILNYGLISITIMFAISGTNTVTYFITVALWLMYNCTLESNAGIDYITHSQLHLMKQHSDIIPHPYYSLLSPYTSINITKLKAPFLFAAIFYIPIFATIAQALHIKHNSMYNNIMSIVLLNIIIILVYAKYIMGLFIGYVVSHIYPIQNNKLVHELDNIHIILLLLLGITNFLFGFVLYDFEKSDQMMGAIVILSHAVFNFMSFMKVCEFFKCDDSCDVEIFEYDNNVYYTRGIFLCKCEGGFINTSNEKYYLNWQSLNESPIGKNICYFGKGFNGRARVFTTCVSIPTMIQMCGFVLYNISGSKGLYMFIISMSYVIWVIQVIFKSIIKPVYDSLCKIISKVINEIVLHWTVEIHGVIMDDNIKPA